MMKESPDMQKLNYPQQKSLHEILVYHGGATPVSEWTTGSGSRTSRRTLPAYCSYVRASEIYTLRGAVRKRAEQIMRLRPRVQELVVVTDLRAARKTLRDNDWSLTNPFADPRQERKSK